MKRLIAPLGIALLLVGCGPSKSEYIALFEEHESLKEEKARLSDENSRLSEENAQLNSRLEELVAGPKKLYGDLLAAMELKDYATAYRQGKTLIERYPETTEAIRARNSVGYAQSILENRTLEAKSRLKARHDYASGITWFYHRDSAEETAHSPVLLYIGQQGQTLFLRMRVQRAAIGGSRWQGFEVLTDQESFRIPLESDLFKQRAVTGGVWQWYDVPVEAKERRLIQSVIRSRVNRVLFFGDDAQELAITPVEQRMIAQVFSAFEALNDYPVAP